MKHVLKTAITFALLIYGVTLSWAQDIIVTNQSQKIEAKIIEVSKTEIRYKELDNINGPTFIIGVEDINSIIYANGKVILYNTPQSESTSTNEGNVGVVEGETMKTTTLNGLFGNNNQTEEKHGADQLEINRNSNNGNSWSLSGRKLISLPKPATDFNQEGKVVVEINVNAAGYVVSAMCTNGTTISDQYTRQLALDAARKARFSASKNKMQVGTITYTFKLN